MSRQKFFFLLWAGVLVSFAEKLHPQATVITLVNPSFEDEPRHSKPPLGWYFCGQPGETPPDIHPTGAYGVEQPPKSGHTYAGMVVRDNQTWEALGQQLTSPMAAGQCYELKLYLSRSSNYSSFSRSTNAPADFITPIRLRIWGGDFNCKRDQLLAATAPIDNDDWQQVTLHFRPNRAFSHLILEAFYADETAKSDNGNILIDDLSPLVPVDCEDHYHLYDLPVVEIPEPSTQQEWYELIRREGLAVRFTNNNADIERHYFKTLGGQPLQENEHLYRIAGTLDQPGRTLLVVVKASSRSLAEHRAGVLTRAFNQLALTENQVKVRTYRNRDSKIPWTAINAAEGLYFLGE